MFYCIYSFALVREPDTATIRERIMARMYVFDTYDLPDMFRKVGFDIPNDIDDLDPREEVETFVEKTIQDEQHGYAYIGLPSIGYIVTIEDSRPDPNKLPDTIPSENRVKEYLPDTYDPS